MERSIRVAIILFRFVRYRGSSAYSFTLKVLRHSYSACLPSFHWLTGRRYPVTRLNTSQGCLFVFIGLIGLTIDD